ncbi:MAG: membrane protein [Bacillota bacterium]
MRRYILLFPGFFVMSLGMVFIVQGNLGSDPWSVLHLGITNHLPVTLGQANQLVGVLIIITSYALGVKPTFATVLNMFFVGFFIDIIQRTGLVPWSDSVFSGVFFVFLGSCLLALGIAMYVSLRLGAGPRDSLTLALASRTRSGVGPVRTTMELVCLAAGWALGGPVGLGTLLSAASMGTMLAFWLRVLARDGSRTGTTA